MPPNLEATKIRNRHVWRQRSYVLVSFPTIARAFAALDKLSTAGRECEYDGTAFGRYWIKFSKS